MYLSSPRHTDSGSRGECGWQENRNGRHWNINAAYKQSYNTNTSARLYDRKYQVKVSGNSGVVDGWKTNRTESNNWGANVHIVTHTNAQSGGCGQPANYLLVMFSQTTNSQNLTNQLLAKLDPVTPGGQNSWTCDGVHGECAANAAHRAYVELFFHTSQSAVNWYQAGGNHGTGVNNAWYYGFAVDAHLGYPR